MTSDNQLASVSQVTGYMTSKGWESVHLPQADTYRFTGPNDGADEPIEWLFPANERFLDYEDCLHRLLRALSAIEQRPTETILAEMLERTISIAS